MYVYFIYLFKTINNKFASPGSLLNYSPAVRQWIYRSIDIGLRDGENVMA